MIEIKEYNETTFEGIKRINEFGVEYWFARELQSALEYKRWDRFHNVIDNAKMVEIGSKTSRKVIDYKLSRYTCYLIVQNADPRKEIVALGQTYFAVQTRKQEINEKEYNELTEEEKRFYQRNLTKKSNYSLNKAAKNGNLLYNLYSGD